MIDTALLKDPKTSERVLKIVESYAGSLPTTGFLAGQSICSALRELSGCTKGVVYNDGDIFSQIDPSATHVATKPSSTWVAEQTHMSGVAFEIESRSDYSAVPQLTSLRTSYSLRAIHSEKFLQHIYVDMLELSNLLEGNMPSSLASWMLELNLIDKHKLHDMDALINLYPALFGLNILAGFDINATRVGICLDTLQLVYMPDFKDYSLKNQLEVSCSNTPFQSMVRVLKKHEEGIGYLDKAGLVAQTKLVLFDYQSTPFFSEKPAHQWEPGDAEHEVQKAWEERHLIEAFSHSTSSKTTKLIAETKSDTGWKDVLARMAQSLRILPKSEKSTALKTLSMKACFQNRAPVLTGNTQIALSCGLPTLKRLESYPEILAEFELVPHSQAQLFMPVPRLTTEETVSFVSYTAKSLQSQTGYLPWSVYGLVSKLMNGKLKKSLASPLDNLIKHVSISSHWVPSVCGVVVEELVHDEHAFKKMLPLYQSAKQLIAMEKLCKEHSELTTAAALPVNLAYYVMTHYQKAAERAEFKHIYSVAERFSVNQWLEMASLSPEMLDQHLDVLLQLECDAIRDKNILKKVFFALNAPEEFKHTYSVKELTLQLELDNESKVMHHCVRGYGGQVSAYECFIVRIRHESNRADLSGTLEVRINPYAEAGVVKFEVYTQQLRALSNKDCSEEVKTIAKDVCLQIKEILNSASEEERVSYLGKQREWQEYKEICAKSINPVFDIDQPYLLSSWYKLKRASSLTLVDDDPDELF